MTCGAVQRQTVAEPSRGAAARFCPGQSALWQDAMARSHDNTAPTTGQDALAGAGR